MPLDRKDLVLREDVPKRPRVVNEVQLLKDVDEAAALAALVGTRGWKILLDNFIAPRMSIERLLRRQGPFRQAEERGSVRTLKELIEFVEGRITEGQKSNDDLEALRKNGR